MFLRIWDPHSFFAFKSTSGTRRFTHSETIGSVFWSNHRASLVFSPKGRVSFFGNRPQWTLLQNCLLEWVTCLRKLTVSNRSRQLAREPSIAGLPHSTAGHVVLPETHTATFPKQAFSYNVSYTGALLQSFHIGVSKTSTTVLFSQRHTGMIIISSTFISDFYTNWLLFDDTQLCLHNAWYSHSSFHSLRIKFSITK